MRNLYREVSDRILAQLEAGSAPWIKPWSHTPGANVPQNAVSGRAYSGVNAILLWATLSTYSVPRFLTFKQAGELGGHVKKGERGFKVYFVKTVVKRERGEAGTEEVSSYGLLREYTVFNVAQCEGLPERYYGLRKEVVCNTQERDATIDEFVAACGVIIREGAGEAYYAPGADYVSMPAFASFKSAAAFQSTRFHEMAHWTGAKHRLARDFGKRFGDKAYAAEELVAELCAAFLCAEFSIDGELRHAGYISHWIALLRDDPKAFFTAASKAQQAADHLRELTLAEEAGALDVAA